VFGSPGTFRFRAVRFDVRLPNVPAKLGGATFSTTTIRRRFDFDITNGESEDRNGRTPETEIANDGYLFLKRVLSICFSFFRNVYRVR